MNANLQDYLVTIFNQSDIDVIQMKRIRDNIQDEVDEYYVSSKSSYTRYESTFIQLFVELLLNREVLSRLSRLKDSQVVNLVKSVIADVRGVAIFTNSKEPMSDGLTRDNICCVKFKDGRIRTFGYTERYSSWDDNENFLHPTESVPYLLNGQIQYLTTSEITQYRQLYGRDISNFSNLGLPIVEPSQLITTLDTQKDECFIYNDYLFHRIVDLDIKGSTDTTYSYIFSDVREDAITPKLNIIRPSKYGVIIEKF